MTTVKHVAAIAPSGFLGQPRAIARLHRPDEEGASRDSKELVNVAAHSALFMSETIEGLNVGARFLDRLSVEQRAQVRAAGRCLIVRQGDPVFSQGEHHDGIFIIDRG